MFSHLMGNDPRPHYAHQSNLAEDGPCSTRVMDRVIGRYKAYFKPPLVQFTPAEIGQEIASARPLDDDRGRAARCRRYLLDGQIHIENRTGAAVEVPVTGVREHRHRLRRHPLGLDDDRPDAGDHHARPRPPASR